MNKQKQDIDRAIKSFVSISEVQNKIYFTFTNASIDILKQYYIALDDEVSTELKNAVLSNDETQLLSTTTSILSLLDLAEKEVYCEQFLSQRYPNVIITDYAAASNTIEIHAAHCGRKNCAHCVCN